MRTKWRRGRRADVQAENVAEDVLVEYVIEDVIIQVEDVAEDVRVEYVIEDVIVQVEDMIVRVEEMWLSLGLGTEKTSGFEYVRKYVST